MKDLKSWTFHLALLDALGLMDWTFSRMKEECNEAAGFDELGEADGSFSGALDVDVGSTGVWDADNSSCWP